MLAVLGALFANGLIAILKFIGAAMTGSSGMMAEALHSVADTTNQIFLLLGLRFYKRPASEKHPFGYGKERFFWSFIAAIFIFGVGATYAIYEGIEKLRHPHPPTNLKWAFWILGISFVLESRLDCIGDLPGSQRGAPRRFEFYAVSSRVEGSDGEDSAL